MQCKGCGFDNKKSLREYCRLACMKMRLNELKKEYRELVKLMSEEIRKRS